MCCTTIALPFHLSLGPEALIELRARLLVSKGLAMQVHAQN